MDMSGLPKFPFSPEAVEGAGREAAQALRAISSPPSPTSHVLDVYGTHLHLVSSEGQWAALAEQIPDLGDFPANLGATRSRDVDPNEGGYGEHHVVIYIHPGPFRDEPAKFAGTVAHECVHAASYIFERIGATHTDGDEPFAYLVDWLVTWVGHQRPLWFVPRG